MPRKPRQDIIGAYFYHIISQGINKEYIFAKTEYKNKYLDFMTKYNNKNISIIKICIMDNHVHLLIYTSNVKYIIEFMHKLNTKYARYYNKINDRVGYVFKGRYKCQPIKSEKHLYNCIKYIDYNPIKPGIIKPKEVYGFSDLNTKNNKIKTLISKLDTIDMNFNEDENSTFKFEDTDEHIEKLVESKIKDFLRENNMEKEELKDRKDKLIILVKKLRNEFDLSYRKLQNNLGIGKETIRKIEKKERKSHG